jgi:hypothetical protein
MHSAWTCNCRGQQSFNQDRINFGAASGPAGFAALRARNHGGARACGGCATAVWLPRGCPPCRHGRPLPVPALPTSFSRIFAAEAESRICPARYRKMCDASHVRRRFLWHSFRQRVDVPPPKMPLDLRRRFGAKGWRHGKMSEKRCKKCHIVQPQESLNLCRGRQIARF